MSLPFRRSPRAAQRAYGAPRLSVPALSQRAWEVEVVLSPLHPLVRDALRPWLLRPTDLHRWPPPDSFSPQRAPISRGRGRRWDAPGRLQAAARGTANHPSDAGRSARRAQRLDAQRPLDRAWHPPAPVGTLALALLCRQRDHALDAMGEHKQRPLPMMLPVWPLCG